MLSQESVSPVPKTASLKGKRVRDIFFSQETQETTCKSLFCFLKETSDDICPMVRTAWCWSQQLKRGCQNNFRPRKIHQCGIIDPQMSGKNVVRPQKGQPKENGRKSKNVCCKVNQSTQQWKKSTLLPGSQPGLRRKKETVPGVRIPPKSCFGQRTSVFRGRGLFNLNVC